MAKCKVTLYLDIVSPFGYMAYYMLRVSRTLSQCSLLPLTPGAVILFVPFMSRAESRWVYSVLLFVLVRQIGLSLPLQNPLKPLLFPINTPKRFTFPLYIPERRKSTMTATDRVPSALQNLRAMRHQIRADLPRRAHEVVR
jgi:hypothetical protein